MANEEKFKSATESPTTASPTTASPTTASPTTESPTTESPTTESPTTADSPPDAAPQGGRVQVDDRGAICSYANFCRVTGTPEELIIDFGLNSQPFGVPSEPVTVTQRLVTNYYTAKRMLHALHLSVQRHEQAFGALEVDVQKRVVGKAQS